MSNRDNRKNPKNEEEDEESEYQLKLDESVLKEQKEVLEEKFGKRKLSRSISYSDKGNNLESGMFSLAFHKDKPDNDDKEISILGGHENFNIEAVSSIFRKNSEVFPQEKIKESIQSRNPLKFPFLKEKLTEESSNAEHSKNKYEIIYNKNESFGSKFKIDYKPLSPFLWALEFVKRIKQQESKINVMPDSNPLKKPILTKRSYRDSELEEVFLNELKKCQKLSRKLRRAWNLDQQILQNVFKKMVKQSTKSLSEVVSYNESYISPDKKSRYEAIRPYSIFQPGNLENNPHIHNLEGSRNLRITTKLKKQQNIILNQKKKLSKQSQNCKKAKEYDYYELLDYSNKNISKDHKSKDQSSDEPNQK